METDICFWLHLLKFYQENDVLTKVLCEDVFGWQA